MGMVTLVTFYDCDNESVVHHLDLVAYSAADSYELESASSMFILHDGVDTKEP